MENIITLTDSYKQTHHEMLPEGTEKTYAYFESRTGAKFPYTTFFGLQYLIKKHLLGQVVTQEKIDKAAKLCARHFGTDKLFDRAGWEYILKTYNGKLPIEIRAVPEGLKVPTGNVLMAVVNTDPKVAWLTNHLETLLTHVWGASTVATLSATTKDMFQDFLEKTCDQGKDFGGLAFMLHDFGMRGVSSMEGAEHLGAGHLINFLGTDTITAMEHIEDYYGGVETGFSVVATEHSIMTAKGREGEEEVIQELLNRFPEGILSVVSDSYDIYNCVDNIYGKKFKEQILARNGKLVVRPDSGDPVEVTIKVLNSLANNFGFTVNNKGYKVLNPKVGMIWGDGIDQEGIRQVCQAVMNEGFSTENLVFGMGGGLLQKINRDTQRFAFKSCAQFRQGKWHDVYKDPIDGSKASKRGIQYLVKDEKLGYKTLAHTDLNTPDTDVLVPVYRNGELLVEYDFNQVRDNTNK